MVREDSTQIFFVHHISIIMLFESCLCAFCLDSGREEPPSSLLWSVSLLAQHKDVVGQSLKSLELINEAIYHTPTDVQLYMIKARIFKVTCAHKVYKQHYQQWSAYYGFCACPVFPIYNTVIVCWSSPMVHQFLSVFPYTQYSDSHAMMFSLLWCFLFDQLIVQQYTCNTFFYSPYYIACWWSERSC